MVTRSMRRRLTMNFADEDVLMEETRTSSTVFNETAKVDQLVDDVDFSNVTTEVFESVERLSTFNRVCRFSGLVLTSSASTIGYYTRNILTATTHVLLRLIKTILYTSLLVPRSMHFASDWMATAVVSDIVDTNVFLLSACHWIRNTTISALVTTLYIMTVPVRASCWRLITEKARTTLRNTCHIMKIPFRASCWLWISEKARSTLFCCGSVVILPVTLLIWVARSCYAYLTLTRWTPRAALMPLGSEDLESLQVEAVQSVEVRESRSSKAS